MKRITFFFKNFLMYGFFFLSTAFVSANFQIVEVMPNTIDDKNLEYITIQNTSSGSLSLSGYVLSDKKKDFLFVGDIFLDGGAKQRFFRPETKLVLNNSDEKLTLKNPTGEIISEVEYASSTKGNFLSFEAVDAGNTEEIISDETLISGEVFISDEASISPPEFETGSTNSGGTLEVPELKVPEVNFGLQRPSYITQSGSSDTYLCDSSKEECKVNFDLRPSFSDDFPEKDYICKIDFGFGILTGQEQKCNPNTIVFPKGEHEVLFQIFHEDDLNLVSEKKITVQNFLEVSQSTQEGNSQEEESENTQDTSQQVTDSGGLSGNDGINTEILKAPEVVFQLQRPSYISQSGSTNIFLCDNSKEECKVNFDLRPSFSDDFPEKDYICKIDYGFGEVTGEEQKCNPNTVIFPEGKHSVKIRIFHEDDSSVFSEKSIVVHNLPISFMDKPHSTSSQITGSSSIKTYLNTSSKNKIHISYPRIIVQSGLTGDGRYFYCTKSECKINLNYEKRHKNERCFWKFGGGKPGFPTTYKRCNPGYVSYEPGIYELSLEVYEKSNRTNRKVFRFFVYNEDTKETEKDDGVAELYPDEKGAISENIFMGEPKIKEILANITLQGKQAKSQIRGVLGVLCQGVEKCYLNFTASGFSDSQKYSYQWLNNGELFSEKYNPSGAWFDVGKHTIEFKVFQNNILLSKTVYVALVSKEELFISNKEKVSKTQIKKEKTAKKNFTQNYLPLKHDGFRISGKAPIGSKVEVFLGERLLGSSRVNQKGKYRILTKNIGAGNHIFSTKIISLNGEKKIYENSGEYTLLQEKRAFWFVSKKSRKRSSSKSQTRTNFLPELVISAHADESYERAIQETHLTPSQKMLSYLLLAIALFGAILHMVFRQIEGVMGTSLVSLYNLRFSTKQRVNLLVG